MAEGFGAQAPTRRSTRCARRTRGSSSTPPPPAARGPANAATETTRKQATWGSASGGAVANTNVLTWSSIAATGTEDVTHFTAWTASSVGDVRVLGDRHRQLVRRRRHLQRRGRGPGRDRHPG